MDIATTPLDITAMLLLALAMYSVYVSAKNRFESNIPLLFYGALVIFLQFSHREIDSYLFGGGVASALVLRFEFMNRPFTRIVVVLEITATGLIGAKLAGGVFGVSF